MPGHTEKKKKMKALPKYGKMPIKKHTKGHTKSEKELKEAGGVTAEMEAKYKKYKEAGGKLPISQARKINFKTPEQSAKRLKEMAADKKAKNIEAGKKMVKERMSEDGGLVFKETDAVINPNVRRREKEREMKEEKVLPKHSKVKPALYQMKPKMDGMPKFTYAAMQAKKAGKKSFEYAGKTFPVKKGTYGSTNKALYKAKMPAMYKLGVKGLNALDK